MEKRADTSSGFSGLDKKSSSNSESVRSMKLQTSTAAFPSKISMIDIHHQGKNLDHPFFRDDDDVCGGGGGTGGGVVGPTNNNGGANEVVGNICRDDVSSSGGGGGENFSKSTNLQPFDVLPSSYRTVTYKSPG